MPEEALVHEVASITKAIKVALLQKDMTYIELADLLDTSPQTLNRAIHGDMSPQSKRLRAKIYKPLGIE